MIMKRASGESHRAVLHSLFAEKGIDQYGVYFNTGEGNFGPDGVEEMSGNVISADGRIFSYWTKWDREHWVLDEWVSVDAVKGTDEEYERARRDAGLS